MKKLFALFLALTMVFTMAVTASAADTNQTSGGTTTLTTTVPAASYTLNIPADQTIPYGNTGTKIGGVTVTLSDGFAEGKNLNVSAEYSAFTCPDVSTTIPFSLMLSQEDYLSDKAIVWEEDTHVCFRCNSGKTVSEYPYVNGASQWSEFLFVSVDSDDWGKALAGVYTATISFSAEVVVE